MLVQRMIRAVRLDPDLYYEVQRDTTATGQAFVVMLIVVACSLVGYSAFSPQAFMNVSLCTIMGWLFWTMIALLVGSRFGGRAEFHELIRPVAFAHSPGVLYAFAAFPGLGWQVSLVAWIWTMVATFVAIREALRLAPREALVTVVITTLIVAAINLVTGFACSTAGLLVQRLGL